MRKVIAFDFDGTLIDTMSSLADIAAAVINEYHGLAVEMARELFLRTSGRPFAEQIQRIFPDQPENKALVAEFERRKVAKLLDEPLFPEVKQLLVDLAAMGYINVISSSNVPDMIEKYVAKHDLKIEKVLGFRAPDFYKGKPHFDFLKAHYGVSNEEILFLGDSPEDYEHSALNSIPFIGRTGTFSREVLAKVGIKHIVDDLSEIKSMIEKV